MPDKIIASFERPNGEQVRLAKSEFKGKSYFSLRAWYDAEGTGDWRPGKNGINLPIEELPAFLALVDHLRGEPFASA